MIVTVYAIAKNEEQHVERFVNACKDADDICVLDTGSTDDTLPLLRGLGCITEQEVFDPWRFDTARNRSMELIPPDTDVAVCLDIDEVLLSGWREALERAWTEDAAVGSYICIAGRNADGSPQTSFFRQKLHRPSKGTWVYPVHEVLQQTGTGRQVTVPDMLCEHLPDESKSRGSYLPLLELAAQERPQDARCAHYLGREYMYKGRWDDAIRELTRALTIDWWDAQRSASERYIAKCLAEKGDTKGAYIHAINSVCEAPVREAWFEAEKVCYLLKDWKGVVWFGERARQTPRADSGINEAEAWGSGVADYLSIGYWNLRQYDNALRCGREALALEPTNERIKRNVQFYEEAIR